MSDEITLRQWLNALSDMIGGNLNPNADLDVALEWFSELPESELDDLHAVAKDNPSIQQFLDLGHALMASEAEG